MAGALVTLAESWNGTRWSLVRSPNVGREGNRLVGVSCVSANACMAVGFTQGGPGGTLAESWNGSRWSVVHTPSPGNTGSDLGGVSCVAADACTAVGAFSTNGVSCPSPDMCMAAGFFFGQSHYRTMTLLGTATG